MNINPALFNFVVAAYERLKDRGVALSGEAVEEFAASLSMKLIPVDAAVSIISRAVASSVCSPKVIARERVGKPSGPSAHLHHGHIHWTLTSKSIF